MGKNKRDSEYLDYDEPSKRPRHSSNGPSKGATQGRIDPTYGQRSAFPGLDEDSGSAFEDEDMDYGEDAEALSYLRTVRSEAAGIPTVLVAPRPMLKETKEADRFIYDDGVGDSRGFYSDGAYTAAPDPEPEVPVDSQPTRHLRDGHFERILEQFRLLRAQLTNVPPRHAVERLDKDHDSYMSPSAADYRKWRWRLINTEPMNAQLARMCRGTLLRLLRLLTNDKLAMGGNTIPSERTSRWIWGVLARLPDGGEMNSEEIGLVRDLGKRAVWLGIVMSQPPSSVVAGMPGSEDNQDYEGESDDANDENDEDIEEDDVCSNAEFEGRVVLTDVVKDKTEVDASGSQINFPVIPQGRACFYDAATTEEEAKQDRKAALARAECFWGDTPNHIMAQFDNKGCDSMEKYKGHFPNPEIFHILRNDNGDRTAEEIAGAKERLRNFFIRNQDFSQFRFQFVYQRNTWAEQYDGPEPPKWIRKALDDADGDYNTEQAQAASLSLMEFVRDHVDYRYALFGRNTRAPGNFEARDTTDDEYGDEAFDRAWRVAGLDTPQTRIYDQGQDEEEEIALAKLGLVAGKNTLPVVAEEPQPDKGQNGEESLEQARDRALAQLGEATERSSAELARAQDAMKERELGEHVCEDGQDSARLLNAKATVDMIITVVGEIYGQRDLLEFRETWD